MHFQSKLHRLGSLRSGRTWQGGAKARNAVDRDIFNEEIDIARIADDTGFDSAWTIEHHFTPYTMVTNPLQYLTYIASITKRVDLGTMVLVPPWHNPVRVAEDVNMLDSFLGAGREIICGVGRGLGRREYEGMGVDQNEGWARFDEAIQIIQRLLATGECDFDGEYYKIRGLHSAARPDRDLSENLWCASGTFPAGVLPEPSVGYAWRGDQARNRACQRFRH